MHCSIYKGRRNEDTYLFIPCKDDFSSVPEAVLKALGEPIHVMDLVLTPERRLARSEAKEVLSGLLHKGCYVQLPPRDEELL
ncbi:hypothetical protein CAI21_17910 [Alkalilimnicola ehrlichii]|uniref:YcgL domain-containing protein CAL65_18275 n=1 Tax=Alkalilimnicola ehrlichii TaxID=351052 RepID=A0A3E0WLT2_9GAMM|nr:YcgL domain-containing protein [Alkalilimnicola ehrlichii]RFA25836.1 hypothetical protein CAI21_17910 [Alkalilimnicola ehrlichii]RFA33111.1 hypothetical protein CAL65_18275 [Alkalilimnicola ehrlichii]